MYLHIENENYGYAVATYGDYVAVANPAITRYTLVSASVLRTGSVDIFRYNKGTDQHDFIETIYRPAYLINVVLSTEDSGSGPKTASIATTKTSSLTVSRSLLIDEDLYTSSVEDGFGLAMDMYQKQLIVGSPYATQVVQTSASYITASSASVAIFDLGLTEYPALSSSIAVYTIGDPDLALATWQSESFGRAVSINRDWIIVGSPLVSGSNGMVYVFRNQATGSHLTWSLYQKLEPSGAIVAPLFGSDLKLNKSTASFAYTASMIIGCGNPANAKAYYYDLVTGSWTLTHVFTPNFDTMSMTFADYTPYGLTMNTTNGYGSAVSTFGTTVVIGEYLDRMFYEFSGSSLYQQGSVNVYERCTNQTMIDHVVPTMPNEQIVFTTNVNTPSQFVGLVQTPEGRPHATIKVNGKLYCGGWNGFIYVLNTPDDDITNITTASCIAGNYISAVCYSSVTGYLYFINGSTLGLATGSITRVNPNDISDQKVIVQGLPGTTTLAPLVTDGNYLFTMTNGHIYKFDILTGALVASVIPTSASVVIGGAHGGLITPDNQTIYFSIYSPGMITKVNPTNLAYTVGDIIYGHYPQDTYPDLTPFSYSVNVTDDIAYLNGNIYCADEFNGNVFRIDGNTLTSSINTPLSWNCLGVYADTQNVYVLQYQEIWVYPNGDLENGPIRMGIGGGTNPNELWITDGGKFVYTDWQFSTGKVYSYIIPWHYEVPSATLFTLDLKTYGTPLTLKNNRMGYSVDVFDNSAIAGIPKIDLLSMDSCYIGGTLEQLHQCNSDLENLLSGQAMLLQKNTSSGHWGITNVYQKKKRFLSPYRDYGFDVSIDDRSMVVGAPMLLEDSNRDINIDVTSSAGVDLDDVCGKAYIYNMANLHEQFHVGNIFYRNGKFILMTSGSVFDGLFFNAINSLTYEYDLQFQGEHTIFEKQVVCTVDPGEFNVSTNPTAVMVSSSVLDINGNGRFDYQDLDIILRYMQYKNTSILGVPISTDWSSSIVKSDDEISLLNWYQQNFTDPDTVSRFSSSFTLWEGTGSAMQTVLDLNQDNKIDIRDMNIMWKYFTNRLTQANYGTFVTPSCQRKLFSDIIDYMDGLSKRKAKPQIKPDFLTYEQSVAVDKTGSFLAPLATTIGLYDGLDLVAVAKLGNPMKITPELPINFVVKMDY